MKELALTLLRKATDNPKAAFREGQWEAIEHVANSKGPLLVIERTGWGKSLVYFISTAINRRVHNRGLTLLVSPLLSLMRNQVQAAAKAGIAADRIDSSNTKNWSEIEKKIKKDELDVLLISPERLANEKFNEGVLIPIANRIGMLVIDEVHCISDWGHDFRPDYRRIENIIRFLPPNVPLIGTTATANNRVIKDLSEIFTSRAKIQRGNLARVNISFQSFWFPGKSKRLAWLADNLNKIKGVGIIYVLTVRDTLQISEWLSLKNIKVAPYSSQSSNRERLEQDLLKGKYKALVSTSALGMGFDMPNCAFIIHFQRPPSIISYYQQAGRAGRGIKGANCILFSGKEDRDIHDYFIDTAFPSKSQILDVLEALDPVNGLSKTAIEAKVNLPRNAIDKVLKLMSVEKKPPLIKKNSRWLRTPNPIPDIFFERAEKVREIRKLEQKEMDQYAHLKDGHMEYLMRALDSPDLNYSPSPDAPTNLPEDYTEKSVNDANDYLNRLHLKIIPRKIWPTGLSAEFKGKMSEEQVMGEGRSLAYWGDDGWGELIVKGKQQDGYFSDELIKAFCVMIEIWNPKPFPTWVTSVPSLDHPQLVPAFAEAVAARLKLPVSRAITKTKKTKPQKTMNNSAQQLRNILSTFTIDANMVFRGPVLLLDDVVDSRWTLTYVSKLLRGEGVPKVCPATLASSSTGEIIPINES